MRCPSTCPWCVNCPLPCWLVHALVPCTVWCLEASQQRPWQVRLLDMFVLSRVMGKRKAKGKTGQTAGKLRLVQEGCITAARELQGTIGAHNVAARHCAAAGVVLWCLLTKAFDSCFSFVGKDFSVSAWFDQVWWSLAAMPCRWTCSRRGVEWVKGCFGT